MSKYKVGDKVVVEITGVSKYGECYEVAHTSMWNTIRTERVTEPLSTYTEPLEAKIRRQAAEITRLLAENMRLKPNYENIRAKEQNEAWELAGKIALLENGYSNNKLKEIFGSIYLNDIFNLTYIAAAAKVEAWEKAKEEIKVGDEVELINGVKFFVTYSCEDIVNGVSGCGRCFDGILVQECEKTGRHIDIDSFLKQIGEE